jgi:hypothetical protein
MFRCWGSLCSGVIKHLLFSKMSVGAGPRLNMRTYHIWPRDPRMFKILRSLFTMAEQLQRLKLYKALETVPSSGLTSSPPIISSSLSIYCSSTFTRCSTFAAALLLDDVLPEGVASALIDFSDLTGFSDFACVTASFFTAFVAASNLS